MALLKDGYFDDDELEKLPCVPSKERLEKGPVAVIECGQEIPCDPCKYACKKKAIKIGDNITDLPKLDYELCNGCGLCIAACPGLAIFVVDLTYSESEAVIQIPYEYFPLPQRDLRVKGIDRAGKVVCNAVIKKVSNPKNFDRTAVITIAVPREFGMVVRNIGRLEE